MPESAAPNPDPGPDTLRPRTSPNGTVPPGPAVPPEPPVPPVPSEVTKERTSTQRPSAGGFQMVMLPLRKMMHRPSRQP